MIFVTGPAFSGKRTFVRGLFPWDGEEERRHAVWEAQEMVLSRPDLSALAEELSRYDAVTLSESGGGIVPVEEAQRRQREDAGRLACLLAEKADTVVRVCCGLPQVLKGTLP